MLCDPVRELAHGHAACPVQLSTPALLFSLSEFSSPVVFNHKLHPAPGGQRFKIHNLKTALALTFQPELTSKEKLFWALNSSGREVDRSTQCGRGALAILSGQWPE